jgi:carbon monoxide dehydrogenase subunit G
MAMTMTGEVNLPANREAVWAALNDPEVLKSCIPGCQELTKVSDTEFEAVAKVAVGPVKASFKGKISLQDLDPPNAYTIRGEGQGGVAGFAKGGAKVRLEPGEEGGTKLIYDVEATVGGKLAQLGGRLVNGVAKKNADEFFACFVKALTPVEAA